MIDLYHKTSLNCSKLVTNAYSTSFSLGIKSLAKKFHDPVYSIYGFVRFADEIVDTFHNYDKQKLLKEFKEDTYRAIEKGISLNPVLHAFQKTVNTYNIPLDFIDSFLYSMEMDLYNITYDDEKYKKYIYGSAEVVGLMCLKVFCHDKKGFYEELEDSAKHLGAAFQKVNFLRDIKSDFKERGRVYFPNVDFLNFSEKDKKHIEKDIEADFKKAYEGIVKLPSGARMGVYLAYVYYLRLFKKIRNTASSHIMNERIRIPNGLKFAILVQSYFRHQLKAL